MPLKSVQLFSPKLPLRIPDLDLVPVAAFGCRFNRSTQHSRYSSVLGSRSPVRGQLVINRRLRVRRTLAPRDFPLLASSGPVARLSLLLRNRNVSFKFISIRAMFCVFVKVLHRPIEITARGRHSHNLNNREYYARTRSSYRLDPNNGDLSVVRTVSTIPTGTRESTRRRTFMCSPTGSS